MQLLDAATGPDGVTTRASSFSHPDAVIDLAARSAIHGMTAEAAAMRVEVLVNRLLRDDRVVPVLAPAARTTGELLRIRDATGRIVRTVDQSYSPHLPAHPIGRVGPVVAIWAVLVRTYSDL